MVRYFFWGNGRIRDVLDFALAADEGSVGVHFDELFGEGL